MSINAAKRVLKAESDALSRLMDSLDESFSELVNTAYDCSGRIVVTGLGKSGLVGHKIAATLASTGTPALYLHPTEALHGDLGMVRKQDMVIALSNSGETEELLRLAPFIKRMGARLVSVTGSPMSSLAKASDLHVLIEIDHEACPLGLAPMASTTAQMAFGDALAAALIEKRGFKAEDFARLHPGGKLGKRLMKTGELMHSGEEIPRVYPSTSMKETIYEISSKKLGMTVVTDDNGLLLGIITDGDMRRLIEAHGGDLLKMSAEDCSHHDPFTISPDVLAVEALSIMESKKITSLIVATEGKVEGVLHLHDLWGLQMI